MCTAVFYMQQFPDLVTVILQQGSFEVAVPTSMYHPGTCVCACNCPCPESWSPQQRKSPLLELLLPVHRSGMSSVEDSFAHLPGLLHRSHGHFSHSPSSSSSSASFYSPVDVAVQPLESGSLSELPSITQGGINWAVVLKPKQDLASVKVYQ